MINLQDIINQHFNKIKYCNFFDNYFKKGYHNNAKYIKEYIYYKKYLRLYDNYCFRRGKRKWLNV